ncbi:MAG TPA: DUF192 domain-containing protein [Patescibacteria group bacterium]|jgi:hypothetical protein|nr:DUF192 domain-containing protein [Patescibacteria group bacterium]
MRKQKLLSNTICFTIIAIAMLAVSCGKTPKNDLQRPLGENQNSNSSNAQNSDEENGQVAGTETIELPHKNISVNGTKLDVEVADNDTARAQGLSGRTKLDDGTGMLFDMTNADLKKPGFWMKDMLISIDIIWINNGKIIGVKANAPLPPEDADLPVYYPPSDVTHVLEVPAGWFAKMHLKIGDTVNL